MSYIYLGKIVNTHGIKGELRLISDFDLKDLVFKKGFSVYIGEEKRKEIINSYRPHKQYDMITLEGYTNINEVLGDLKKSVYIKKEDLNLQESEYLLEELLDCDVTEKNKTIGQIKEIVYNKANILLKVKSTEGKTFYIPYNDVFIKNVNIAKKSVEGENIQGLII